VTDFDPKKQQKSEWDNMGEKISPRRYVDTMQMRLGFKLSTLDQSAYMQAATMAMDTATPYEFKDLHSVLMRWNPYPGVYRKESILDCYPVEVRAVDFPRADAVPKLLWMVRAEYLQMLETRPSGLTDAELQLEIWKIAAKLRYIRPFYSGVRRVSYLFQGQMRLRHGFSFLHEEVSLDIYRRARQKYIDENNGSYGRNLGAR